MRLTLAIIAFIVWLPTISLAGDSEADLKIAADRYIATVDIDKLLDDTAKQIAATLPQEMQTKFIREMAAFDVVRMSRVMLDAMVQVFTVDELNALADFYSTPVGKSILLKMPEYMAEMMPTINQLIIEEATKIIEGMA